MSARDRHISDVNTRGKTSFGSFNIITVHPRDPTETISIPVGDPEAKCHQAQNNGHINNCHY